MAPKANLTDEQLASNLREADDLVDLAQFERARLAKPDLDLIERAKILTRVQTAYRVLYGLDVDAIVTERRRALWHALDDGAMVAADLKDQPEEQRQRTLAVVRASLGLWTFAADAERVSDDLLWHAIEIWRGGGAKWDVLNKLARALKCGAPTDEALRQAMAHLKV